MNTSPEPAPSRHTPSSASAEGFSLWLQHIAEDPHALDLFALLRHVDANAGAARLGYSRTPHEDPVRLGQYPSTIFAPATLHSIEHDGPRPQIKTLSPGVFGPGGALPLHLSEYIRERLHNHGDSTLADFVDMFHHRFISLFYRAWADAQAVVQLDRPGLDNFSVYTGALIGMGFTGSWQRDSIADSAKLHMAGHLVRLTRNREGLQQILAHFFATEVHIDEFVPTWIPIAEPERTLLSGMRPQNQLGTGAMLGERVWDVQSRFRLRLGPMRLHQFERCLPPNPGNRQLRDWVRVYIGVELDWDVELHLHASEVPRTALGGGQRLGWTSWLGQHPRHLPASDLRLHPERDAVRMAARDPGGK